MRRSFTKRPFPRRRRFGPKLRNAKEPGRWEVCNLSFASGTFVDAAQPTFTGVVRLASIFDGLGDTATGQGRAIGNAVRSLEIGGMVVNWNISLESSGAVIPFPAAFVNRFAHRVLIVSDRIDSNGSPGSIPDWFLAGSPLATVSTTTPGPNSDDIKYPLRIHYQWARFFNAATWPRGAEEGDVAPIQTTPVSQLSGSKNLRLKLRLADDQGLFFHFATRILDANDAAPLGWAWACEAVGTLYYRFRF